MSNIADFHPEPSAPPLDCATNAIGSSEGAGKDVEEAKISAERDLLNPGDPNHDGF